MRAFKHPGGSTLRSSLARAAALLFVASCCSGQAAGPARPAELQHTVFTLGETRYEVLLPKGALVTPSSDRVARIIIRDVSRSQRLERLLILEGSQEEVGASYDRTITLASGSILSYRMKDAVGGGSGGPIAELAGRLAIGARVVAVTCTDQGELSRMPDWCVPYLHHLKIASPQ